MLPDFIPIKIVDESGTGVVWPGKLRRDLVAAYFDLTDPQGLVPSDYKGLPGANTMVILSGISKPMLIAENLNQFQRFLDA